MSSREMKLSGWWTFAAILLAISGTLNVIWGIAAIGNSHTFTQHADYVAGNLRTWGWIALILGALELAAFTSIAALLSIPAYPFWSICIFALSIIIIYELERGPARAA